MFSVVCSGDQNYSNFFSTLQGVDIFFFLCYHLFLVHVMSFSVGAVGCTW